MAVRGPEIRRHRAIKKASTLKHPIGRPLRPIRRRAPSNDDARRPRRRARGREGAREGAETRDAAHGEGAARARLAARRADVHGRRGRPGAVLRRAPRAGDARDDAGTGILDTVHGGV